MLGQVVNAATTRIGGPASGGLAPLKLGFTMAVAVSQATRQGSIGAMTLIRPITNNTDVSATTAQGVQLPSTPPTQPVQQPDVAVFVPMPETPRKGAVVAKLLAMNNSQTKEELEGQQEYKV